MAIGALIAGLGSGCAPDGTALGENSGASAPRAQRIAWRLIDQAPTEDFDESTYREDEPVFDWRFEGPEDLAPWSTTKVDTLEVANRALELSSSWQNPQIRRSVSFDASSVDAVELHISGLKAGHAALRWSTSENGPGNIHPRNQIQFEVQAPHNGAPRVYRFPVRSHPHWKGRIDQLEINLGSPAERILRIDRVVGFRTRIDDARMARQVSSPWRVTLADGIYREARPAWITPPGHPVTADVTVPEEGGVLELAVGLVNPQAQDFLRGYVQPVRLRLRAEPLSPGDAGEAAEAGAATLLETRVGADMGWKEQRVDLSDFAGRTVRLIFESPADPSSGIWAQQRGLLAWGNPVLLSPTGPGERAGEPPPVVILVSLDTLRADRLSLYGHDRPTSPHLEAWAEETGVTFLETVAAAPWTLPSHTSMLTGVDALRHGVNFTRGAPADLTTLAERFRAAGWTTAAITGGAYLLPEYGLDQGFDRFRAWTDRHERQREELAANMDQTLAWLDDLSDRPLFLFFHTYEIHHPFDARQPWFSEWSDLDPEVEVIMERPRKGSDSEGLGRAETHRLMLAGPDGPRPIPEEMADLPKARYDSAVAYTDQQLERLFEVLRSPALADRATVVITADHGEMLGEHGLGSHAFLYEENIMIPLVISAPDRRGAGLRVAEQVRQVDVAPTLLELAGLGAAADLDGRSLVPQMEGGSWSRTPPAYTYAANSNQGIGVRLRGQGKLLYDDTAWASETPRARYVDLRDDPGELSPQPAGDPQRSVVREVETRIHRDTRELRLRLAAPADTALEGQILGASLTYTAVKSDRGARCVFWSEPRISAFRLEPGTSCTLRLAQPSGESLEVEIRAGDGIEPMDLTVLLGAPDTLQMLVREDGRWLKRARQLDGRPGTDPELPPGTAVALWWPGQASLGAAPEEGDEAIQEQLRALGYIQ